MSYIIIPAPRSVGGYIVADLVQAAAPIYYAATREAALALAADPRGPQPEDIRGTPYQTADARHDRRRAVSLVAEYVR